MLVQALQKVQIMYLLVHRLGDSGSLQKVQIMYLLVHRLGDSGCKLAFLINLGSKCIGGLQYIGPPKNKINK